MSGLGCFKCSELQRGSGCPNTSTDRTLWKSEPEHYAHSNPGDTKEVCSIIVGESGRIYHQAIIPERLCSNSGYITRVSLNIARQYKDPNSQIKCCSTSGCNFSWSSSGDSDDLVSSNTVLFSVIGGIAFGLFLLLFCLFGCFLIWWKKTQEDSNEGENLYFPRSSFGNRRKKEEMSTMNSYNSQDSYSPPGKKRYMGVGDSLKTDDGGLRVESEGGRAPHKPSVALNQRPEWQDVYGKNKLRAPAQGKTNAFQYSDSGHITTYM